jgi:hypothetical protein
MTFISLLILRVKDHYFEHRIKGNKRLQYGFSIVHKELIRKSNPYQTKPKIQVIEGECAILSHKDNIKSKTESS